MQTEGLSKGRGEIGMIQTSLETKTFKKRRNRHFRVEIRSRDNDFSRFAAFAVGRSESVSKLSRNSNFGRCENQKLSRFRNKKWIEHEVYIIFFEPKVKFGQEIQVWEEFG